MVDIETAIQSRGFKSLHDKVVVNIMYTAYQIKARTGDVLKKEGITGEQFNVLRILKGHHPNKACVRYIAERMIERSSNVPRIIDRLEAKKLVSRTPSSEDKRETLIQLTAAGLNKLEGLNRIVAASNADLTAMSESDLKQLSRLLDQFRKD